MCNSTPVSDSLTCFSLLLIDCYVMLCKQDDGYAGTLENKRKPNTAGELGREGDPFIPMQVRPRAGRVVPSHQCR
jgi:hypothetical protein